MNWPFSRKFTRRLIFSYMLIHGLNKSFVDKVIFAHFSLYFVDFLWNASKERNGSLIV